MQRGLRTAPFSQNGDRETASDRVPGWARSVYVILPELASGTLEFRMSVDEGATWAARRVDLDGAAMPRTAYTGGTAAVQDVLWLDVDGATHVRVVSSAAQTGRSARLLYKE